MSIQKYIAPKSKTNFRFLDGCCASGKSTIVARHIKKHYCFTNQIIVCLKKELCIEWKASLDKAGISSDLIIDKGSVAGISHWFNTHNPDIGTGVLICTQSAIFKLDHVSNKHQCDIWFDELPQTFDTISDRFHTSASILKDHLKLGNYRKYCKTGISTYSRDRKRHRRNIDDFLKNIVASNKKALAQYLKESSNVITKTQKDLFGYAANPNFEVYCRQHHFENLGNVKCNSDDVENEGKTTFVVMTKPSMFQGWKNCTIISADYENSIFKKWIGNRINFKRHESLHSKLRNGGVHPDSWLSKTNFTYLISESEKKGLNSKIWLESNGHLLDSRLEKDLPEGEPLLCTNVDRVKNRALVDRCRVITSKDIGVNKFSSYDTVIFDAALNCSPQVESILNLLGVDTQSIRYDVCFNVAYQIVSRSKLRRLGDERASVSSNKRSDVSLYFADRTTCDYVMARFANKVGCVGNIRHISDSGYQEVVINPIFPNIEYSAGFVKRIRNRNRLISLVRRNKGLVVEGASATETSTAGSEYSSHGVNVGASRSRGKPLDTTGLNELDVNNSHHVAPLGKSITYGAMSKNRYHSVISGIKNSTQGIPSIECRNNDPSVTLSDLPQDKGILCYQQYNDCDSPEFKQSKFRMFIRSIIKNQINGPITATITGDGFFHSNFAIIEFSSSQCSKKQFIKTFNPLRSNGENRKLSFLISEEGETVQAIIFFSPKHPVDSWSLYSQKVGYLEPMLGFELDIALNRQHVLQTSFEMVNCRENIGIARHSL